MGWSLLMASLGEHVSLVFFFLSIPFSIFFFPVSCFFLSTVRPLSRLKRKSCI